MSAQAHHEASLLASIGEWWREYRRRQRAAAELDAFGPEDVARMAHDMGVSTSDLRDLVQRSAHAIDEAPKMMAALGLDPAAMRNYDPALMRDIEVGCARCGAKGQCNEDLEAGTAGEHYKEYCVNAGTFSALTAVHEAEGR